MTALQIVSRAAWGARPAKRQSRGTLNSSTTLHWNGPKVTVGGKLNWTHDKCAGLVRGIQNYHMDANGWADIGYNFVECPHGHLFVGRGINVINGANGTNVGNRTSHAIMSLAGEGNPFPIAERVGIRAGVRYISDETGAPFRCIGHRDHKSTACPGDERYGWAHNGMPVPKDAIDTVHTKKKDISMEAALLLIKIHYDNARGDGKGSYDVSVQEPAGYQHWITQLLDAHDKGQPLKPICDNLGGQLFFHEVANKKK